MREHLARGDVVWLKSGGLAMTVGSTDGRGATGTEVSCSWFKEDGSVDTQGFHPEQLTKKQPSGGKAPAQTRIKGLG